MNDKKNMNNKIGLSGDDVPLSSAEHELYHQLLSLSYPQPKKSIKSGVMEQIRADQSSEKTADSLLVCAFNGEEVSAKKRQTRRMNRFVRYGSIAACFVLIIGAAIGIMPFLDGMTKSNSGASMSADVTAECASYENTMATYAATDAAPVTGVAEETFKPENGREAPKSGYSGFKASNGMCDIALQSSADTSADISETAAENKQSADRSVPEVSDCVEEEAAEAEAMAEHPETLAETMANIALTTDSSTTSDDDSAAAQAHTGIGEGETKAAAAPLPPEEAGVYTNYTCLSCEIHGDTYHTFSDELIEYVGDAAFGDWYDSEEAADECGVPSVATFAAYFEIDRDLFASLTEGSEISYDIDAVYPSVRIYSLR